MEFYTVRQAAESYFANQISISQIYSLVKKKSLNCVFIGHKILIPKEALDEFCKKNLNQT